MVQVDNGPPEDAWETSLSEGATGQSSAGSWPAAQVPQCADGHGPTYLELGYHPLALEIIHLAASLQKVIDAPSKVELVPVYTSVDATQPSLTMASVVGLEPQSGPKKARKATPVEVASTTFARATLAGRNGAGPLGFPRDRLRLRRSLHSSTSPRGSAARSRSQSASARTVSYSTVEMSLPVPPEGTPVAVLMAGGTTKSFVQVAEFQWRGDRD